MADIGQIVDGRLLGSEYKSNKVPFPRSSRLLTAFAQSFLVQGRSASGRKATLFEEDFA